MMWIVTKIEVYEVEADSEEEAKELVLSGFLESISEEVVVNEKVSPNNSRI